MYRKLKFISTKNFHNRLNLKKKKKNQLLPWIRYEVNFLSKYFYYPLLFFIQFMTSRIHGFTVHV